MLLTNLMDGDWLTFCMDLVLDPVGIKFRLQIHHTEPNLLMSDINRLL